MASPARRVLLVVPPFAAIDYPMLGPSLLATACRERNIDAIVFYANLNFAAQIGDDLYNRTSLSSLNLMAGEVLFKDLAFKKLPPAQRSEQILTRYFAAHNSLGVSNPDLSPLTLAELLEVLNKTRPFVNEIAQKLAAEEPSIIGFSSVFQQNLASIALARAVKRLAPASLILLGGANASSPMGKTLGGLVDAFDYIFSGEADQVFPDFVQSYLDDGVLPLERVLECAAVEALDNTPIPDFSQFFEQLDSFRTEGRLLSPSAKTLPMETSRGCWWGAKKHCTFCGLNGLEMSYRAKTPSRILQEFEHQSRRYGTTRFQITDNIMPLKFRTTVLPALVARDEELQIFYEVKSNLKEEELDLFVQAGVHFIQPGIESFSSNILRLINKGVSGIQNLWLLRECASRQIQVLWNILVGLPGESLADYTASFELLPYIEHLQPPRACSPIVIDRFSPYHSRPDEYGIKNVTPFSSYDELYPPETNLSEIAYHFTGEYQSEYLNADLRPRFEGRVESWITSWAKREPPKLYSVQLDSERLFVEDTRSCAAEQRVALDINESFLVKYLRKPKCIGDIPAASLVALPYLMERHLVVEYEGSYISLITEPELGFKLRTTRLAEIKARLDPLNSLSCFGAA